MDRTQSGDGTPARAPAPGRKRSSQRQAAIESLQQQSEQLRRQLQQLELNNKTAKFRQEVLTQICGLLRLGLQVAREAIPVMQGTLALASAEENRLLDSIDTCARLLLRDLPLTELAAEVPQPVPVRWPTSAEVPLAPALADGGCLSLLRHCLEHIHRHPQAFAWIEKQDAHSNTSLVALLQGLLHVLYHNLYGAHSSQGGQSTLQPGHGNVTNSGRGSGTTSEAGSSKPTRPPQTAATAPPPAAATTEPPTQTAAAYSLEPLGNSCAAAVPASSPLAAAVTSAVAVAAGGAEGCPAVAAPALAWQCMAGKVSKALLLSQEMQQQQQQREPHVESNSAILIRTWAELLVSSASCWQPGDSAPPAAEVAAVDVQGSSSAEQPLEAAAAVAAPEAALMGTVLSVVASYVWSHVLGPRHWVEMGMDQVWYPIQDQCMATVQQLQLSREQLRSILRIAAFYMELRRPYWQVEQQVEERVAALMVSLQQSKAPASAAAAEGNSSGSCSQTPDASAAPAAPGAAPSSSNGQDSSGTADLDLGSPDDALQLDQLVAQLEKFGGMTAWFEVLQYCHVLGVLSTKQVAALVISSAPGSPAPNCWSRWLLRQLLSGAPWILKAAGVPVEAKSSVSSILKQLKQQQQQGQQGQLKQQQQRRQLPVTVKPWEPIQPVQVPLQRLGLSSQPAALGQQQELVGTQPQQQQQQQQQLEEEENTPDVDQLVCWLLQEEGPAALPLQQAPQHLSPQGGASGATPPLGTTACTAPLGLQQGPVPCSTSFDSDAQDARDSCSPIRPDMFDNDEELSRLAPAAAAAAAGPGSCSGNDSGVIPGGSADNEVPAADIGDVAQADVHFNLPAESLLDITQALLAGTGLLPPAALLEKLVHKRS